MSQAKSLLQKMESVPSGYDTPWDIKEFNGKVTRRDLQKQLKYSFNAYSGDTKLDAFLNPVINKLPGLIQSSSDYPIPDSSSSKDNFLGGYTSQIDLYAADGKTVYVINYFFGIEYQTRSKADGSDGSGDLRTDKAGYVATFSVPVVDGNLGTPKLYGIDNLANFIKSPTNTKSVSGLSSPEIMFILMPDEGSKPSLKNIKKMNKKPLKFIME